MNPEEPASAASPLGCGGQNAPLSLADGGPDVTLQLLAADQCRDTHTGLGSVRSEAMKPDKMEETLTCIICQDLLHDCVRYAPRGEVCGAAAAGRSGRRGVASLWLRAGSMLWTSLSFDLCGQPAQSPVPVPEAVEELTRLQWQWPPWTQAGTAPSR